MKLTYLITALVLGWSTLSAQAQSASSTLSDEMYKPKMNKSEARAYLRSEGVDLLPDNLLTQILTGDAKGVEAMIVAGLDLKKPWSMPQSPLEMAAQTCSLDGRVKPQDTLRMIDLFIGAGVDPNHAGVAGLSALMVAAQQQCPPVVIKHLLGAGAKIDARTPQGFTPLSMALIVSNFEGAATLIEAGARISKEVGAKFLTGTEDDDPRLVALVKRATEGK